MDGYYHHGASRVGVYSAAALTLATFLAPALLAPGRIELANLAGIAFAIWVTADVWRRYGRQDHGASLAFRVSPVGPGLVASAAILFSIALLHAWSVEAGKSSSILDAIDAEARTLWSFPFSPVRFYALPIEGLETETAASVRHMTLSLTVAVVTGALFCLLSFVARVTDRATLRRHAVIWKGAKMDDAEARLAARGAKGLKPFGDPLADADQVPVTGRLLLRAFVLLIAFIVLIYAPVLLRVVKSSGVELIEMFFASRFVANAFLPMWITALWAVCIAATLIYFGAYLRLGLMLARDRE